MFNILKIIFLLSTICSSFSAIAQSQESIVKKYPQNFRTPDLLAFAIQQDFPKKKDQIRALYYWIAHNINYDINSSSEDNKYDLSDYKLKNFFSSRNADIALKTLKTGKAACEGYACLFNLVCTALDIESKVIGGYTLNDRTFIGTNPMLKNHVWNAYLIDEEWHLADVTWGAGYLNTNTGLWVQEVDDSYFDIAPSRFIKTHFPSSENWQLLEKPTSKKDFFANPILYDYYFKTSTRLSPNHTGLINIDERERTVLINFDEISTDPILYQTRNIKFSRLVKFKKMKSGSYQAKIKLIKGHPSFIKLIENGHTIIEFKIDTTYNYQFQKEN